MPSSSLVKSRLQKIFAWISESPQYLVCPPFAFMTVCTQAAMYSTSLCISWRSTICHLNICFKGSDKPQGSRTSSAQWWLQAGPWSSRQCCGAYICVFMCLLCLCYHLCFVLVHVLSPPCTGTDCCPRVRINLTCFQFTSWFMYEFNPWCIMYPTQRYTLSSLAVHGITELCFPVCLRDLLTLPCSLIFMFWLALVCHF